MAACRKVNNEVADGAQIRRNSGPGERPAVYVELASTEVPTYQFREVELGPSMGDGYAVLSGLEAGERVVTNGAFQLDVAAQLRNQSSMMNRDVIVQGWEVGEVTAMVLPNYREEDETILVQSVRRRSPTCP